MRRSEALLRMRPVPVPPGLSASLCILLKSPVGCLSSRRATCGQDACLQEQRLLSFCPQARLGHHGAPLLSVLFLPDVLPHRLIKRADSQQLVRICASGRWPGARLDRTTKASRKSDSSGGTFTEHCESSWTPPQCCFLPPAIGRFFLGEAEDGSDSRKGQLASVRRWSTVARLGIARSFYVVTLLSVLAANGYPRRCSIN